MTAGLAQIAQPYQFDSLQQIVVVNHAAGRLLVACVLGAAVGLEREWNRKSAGVRTNLLICMGAAFFTLLSAVLAGDLSPNKGLHSKSRVNGLTSAAAVWAVASIGMACGAGLYLAAVVATALVIVSLELVGFLERRANLKAYSLVYEARGSDTTMMLGSILDAMDKAGQRLADVAQDSIGKLQRVSFTIIATNKQHQRLRAKIEAEPSIEKVLTFRDPEED
jgi:putative Mg2+ transporter-C (MgtC) family protein